jgi:hypothetical protein
VDSKGQSRKPTGSYTQFSPSDAEEKLREAHQRNKELEELLAEREVQLSKVKSGDSKFKTYATQLRRLVTDQLENVVYFSCSFRKKW